MGKYRILLVLLCAVSSVLSFSIPNYFWPQNDMPSAEYNSANSEKKVLIIARKTQFKEAVLSKVISSLQNDSVYIKVIGFKQVDKEQLDQYSAIVFVNTCMAWSMENKVSSTLKKHPNMKKFIIVTTAGGPDYVQKPTSNTFDALASASEDSNVDTLAGKMTESIRKLLKSK